MSTPTQIAAVLGRGLIDSASPAILADDLGWTRGDGCFDATRVVTTAGQPRVDHLEAHLARFARSCAGLGHPAPDLDAWRALIAEAVLAWANESRSTEGVVKIMSSAGLESRRTAPTGVLTITDLAESQVRQRAGIGVATLSRGYASDAFADAPWLLGGVKSLSYAVHAAAKSEAVRRGADDALFTTTDGYALEGPTSALIVHRDGHLLTTPTGPTGVLASITVDVLFSGASAYGLVGEHRLMTVDEVRHADGAWLVSSVRGVAPIRALDGLALRSNDVVDRALRDATGFTE